MSKRETAQFRDGASMGVINYEQTVEARRERRKRAAEYIKSLPETEQEQAWDGFEKDEAQFEDELTSLQMALRESAPEDTMFVEDFGAGMGQLMNGGMTARDAFVKLVKERGDANGDGEPDVCACGGGCGCGRVV